jgi:hypothetical protein
MILSLVINVGYLCFWLLFMYRNGRITKMRRRMIETIAQCPDWQWRLKAFESVSYGAMMTRFWKPVRPEAFYADTTFLKPGIRGPVLSPFQLHRP